MSPIAVNEPNHHVVDVAALKASARASERPPLPQWPDAVSPDYMYKFKYQHPLPVHGKGVGVEIPQDVDARSAALEIVARLSDAWSQGDAEAFTDLFLEHGELDARSYTHLVLICPTGVWRDRAALTWDYRTFNWHPAILKASKDLFPRTQVTEVKLIDPSPSVERPYADLSFLQVHLGFTTSLVGATALMTAVLTSQGYKIWTLNTVIDSLHGHPEIPERDGHMTGPHSWEAQRAIDTDFEGMDPEVLIIGGGQNGLMTAARLKALGISSLIIERNARIGDNWRGRYEALSLHLPHWAGTSRALPCQDSPY
jgi:hypothetical protein